MINPVVAKQLVGLTVSFCTSRLVGQLVASQVAPVTNFQKFQMTVGVMGLGSAAGKMASSAILTDVEMIEAAVAEYKAQQAQK